MKKIIIALMVVVMIFMSVACAGGTIQNSGNNKEKVALRSFYDKLTESQGIMDIVADDIYTYWYDCIYKDKYSEDINVAILMAQVDNADNLERIETLDLEIKELFKEVKASDCADLCKEIMSAYSDYYEFVVNVSGSFNSYSADKESFKKELASLLRELSYEL